MNRPYVFALALLAGACQLSDKPEALKQPAKTANYCTYAFDPAATQVNWTAYKFTEKVGVGGTFDEVSISGTQQASTETEVFSKASFTIPISSINSNNPDRDKKIQTYFFGNLSETEMLSGKLVSLSPDGTAQFDIRLNGREETVEGTYTLENNLITLSAVLDVDSWGASPAIAALNEVCYDLHIGEDGISKLWPEVKVEITSKLVPNCR